MARHGWRTWRAPVCCTAAAAWSPGCLAGPDVSGEVLYQIMPIAWRDSDSDEYRYGDFGGLTASLDYLERFGVTGVYLNPIFPSKAYHGYQHGDASKVNPWFGDEAGFRAFVRSAHGRGIKVYLDLVAYGISTDSLWFESAHGRPESEYSKWLAFTDAGNRKWKGYSYTTWSAERIGFVQWNLENDGPVSLVTAWGQHWLEPTPTTGPVSDAVDGYRLDHVFARAPEGWGATIGFWERWAGALRAEHPNVFVFCEPGDWTSRASDVLTPGGFDAAIAKPLEFAMRNALEKGSAAALAREVEVAIAATPPGKTLVVEVNDHDSDRIASVVRGDPARCKLAAAMLLTLPFTPNIYFGDEIAMRGVKASFGGDANDIPMREPFKWKAVAGPPMSDYFRKNAAAYEKRFERDRDGRSVEEQEGVAGSVLEAYRGLIAVRKGSTALQRGRYVAVQASEPRVWSFARVEAAGQAVLVAMNLSDAKVEVSLNLSALSVGCGGTARELVSGTPAGGVTDSNRRAYPLALGPYEYRVIDLGVRQDSK